MEFTDLSIYLLSLIGQNLTLGELDQLCLLNPELDQKICSNNNFWEQIYLSKFGSPLTSPLIWKEAYRQKISDKVFSSGSKTCEQPQLSKFSSTTPVQIPSLKDVISVSAGSYYTLILTSTGDVHACGSNDHGQLGLNTQERGIYSPRRILIPEKVRAISAGDRHSLILTSNGKVYSFGYNGVGWLGLGDQQQRWAPEQIPLSEKIIAVSAGTFHSLILSEEGFVYAFGYNNKGQLGLGDFLNRDRPEKIPFPRKIIAISAGKFHSLILTLNGEVYSFGNNFDGQLGLGNFQKQSIPQPVPQSGQEKIIAISAGAEHSLILAQDGDIYAFGQNREGQLGTGWGQPEIQVTIPQKILPPEKFIAISAGPSYSLFLSSNGSVYSVGANRNGELGLKTGYGALVIPTKIPIKEKIMAISAGNGHSLLLAEGFALFSSIQILIQNDWVKRYEFKYETSENTAVFEFIDIQDNSYLVEVKYNPETKEIFPIED